MTDYPTDDDLRRLREWPADDPAGWFDFARSIWWAADWGWSQTYAGIMEVRPVTWPEVVFWVALIAFNAWCVWRITK